MTIPDLIIIKMHLIAGKINIESKGTIQRVPVIKGLNSLLNTLRTLLFALSILSFTPLPLFADDIRFEVTLDRNRVALGQGMQLNLTFHGSQDVPAPDLKDKEGFQMRYSGPSTRVSIVNGRVSRSVTHMYTMLPEKTGTFKIGPFSITYKGKTYTSNPVTVEVLSGSSAQRGSGQRDTLTSEDLGDRMFLVMEPGKDKIYLNETVPLTIKLYISNLSVRDIQYPDFNREGFSVREFGEPRQYQETLQGKRYDVIEFGTEFFAVQDGDLVLGPALLECNLVVKKQRRRTPSFGGFFDDDIFEDFFGRYQTYPIQLKTPEIYMTVKPLPHEGRPKNFKGATGDFKFHLEAVPAEVKAGDPITLKMTIKGKGNFNTVTPPVLKSTEGFKVYEPQIKQEGNVKTFEQILIPETEKIKAIPEVKFSFFDTDKEKYRTITRGPIPVKVQKTKQETIKLIESKSTEPVPVVKEILGRDIIYIKSNPGHLREMGFLLYKNFWFWVVQTAALFIFLTFLTLHKRRERLRTDSRYARNFMAHGKAREGIKAGKRLLKEKKVGEFYDSLFKTIREYLGDKFHIPPGGITPDSIKGILSEKEGGEKILTKIKEVFLECDLARYTPEEEEKIHKAEETFKKLKEVIDYIEKLKI